MGSDFHSLDLIFLALVAVFIILRLRSVLGKRTGHEGRPEDWRAGPTPARVEQPVEDNVVDLNTRRAPQEVLPQGPLGDGIRDILRHDPSFNSRQFTEGARMAFEMIVDAFAAGNKKVLRPLLHDDVYQPFAQAIDDHVAKGEVVDTELVGILSADVVEARMDGKYALVTVLFVSEQVNLIKDHEGRVLEGDPNYVAEIRDLWTFRRETTSNDPNWQLFTTALPNE